MTLLYLLILFMDPWSSMNIAAQETQNLTGFSPRRRVFRPADRTRRVYRPGDTDPDWFSAQETYWGVGGGRSARRRRVSRPGTTSPGPPLNTKTQKHKSQMQNAKGKENTLTRLRASAVAD